MYDVIYDVIVILGPRCSCHGYHGDHGGALLTDWIYLWKYLIKGESRHFYKLEGIVDSVTFSLVSSSVSLTRWRQHYQTRVRKMTAVPVDENCSPCVRAPTRRFASRCVCIRDPVGSWRLLQILNLKLQRVVLSGSRRIVFSQKKACVNISYNRLQFQFMDGQLCCKLTGRTSGTAMLCLWTFEHSRWLSC